MISLYSGTPGSGKSLHLAKDIRDRAIMGKPTIGNFNVNLSKFKKADYTYLPNDQLKPDWLINYSQEYFKTHRFKEGAICLCIDECQLLFNAREWQQTGRNEWLSFFTQHRHFGYNIILIAQFDRMIDRQIRSLIEYEFIHRKASNYGVGGMIFSFLTGGKLHVSVQMWYPLKARIGSEFFHAKKKYYSIYDSYVTFDANGGTTGGSGAPESTPFVSNQTTKGTKKNILLRSLKPKEKFSEGHIEAPSHPSSVKGSYLRPYNERKLYSSGGKYLLPGGRSETGWSKSQLKPQESPII